MISAVDEIDDLLIEGDLPDFEDDDLEIQDETVIANQIDVEEYETCEDEEVMEELSQNDTLEKGMLFD